MQNYSATPLELKELLARDLILECAANIENSQLWNELYSRFKKKLVMYLWRACRAHGAPPSRFNGLVEDWVQDIFLKLLQNDGKVVRSFRGESEFSVSAFLASIAASTVADYFRAQNTAMRGGQLVGLDDVAEGAITSPSVMTSVPSVLIDLIDIERKISEGGKNPERDVLIFKLHFVEGLTAREIAAIPSFDLTLSGTEKVLQRVRDRLLQDQNETTDKPTGT